MTAPGTAGSWWSGSRASPSDAEWRRAYSEINRFEEQLVDSGVILLKFWLHISQDEQLARFKDRENVPYKRYKITDDDWRNREKWPHYKEAVNEMVVRTSTKHAAWTLVEGNDKPYARVKVMRTICDTLSEALKRRSGSDRWLSALRRQADRGGRENRTGAPTGRIRRFPGRFLPESTLQMDRIRRMIGI